MARFKDAATEISEVFYKVYNGSPNFMTPQIEEYGISGKYYYELSSGDAFLGHGRIFGLTFLDKDTHEKTDLNKRCNSMIDIAKYLSEIKNL